MKARSRKPKRRGGQATVRRGLVGLRADLAVIEGEVGQGGAAKLMGTTQRSLQRWATGENVSGLARAFVRVLARVARVVDLSELLRTGHAELRVSVLTGIEDELRRAEEDVIPQPSYLAPPPPEPETQRPMVIETIPELRRVVEPGPPAQAVEAVNHRLEEAPLVLAPAPASRECPMPMAVHAVERGSDYYLGGVRPGRR